jgi:hypothetical protein
LEDSWVDEQDILNAPELIEDYHLSKGTPPTV